MATTSIRSFGETVDADRLDAEYFDPQCDSIVAALAALDSAPLADSARVARRPWKPSGETFRYIEISDVDPSTSALDIESLPVDEAPSRAQQAVKAGDILVSLVRPGRGASALLGPDEDGAVASSGFAVLSAVDIDPRFLLAFVKTRHVRLLMNRASTATMYPAISVDQLLALPIFKPDTDLARRVCEAVDEVAEARRRSQALYDAATTKLIKYLRLDDFDWRAPRTYWTVDRSAAAARNRIDAEHFNPVFDDATIRITSANGYRTLEKLTSVVRRGQQPEYDEDGEVVVVKSKNVGPRHLALYSAERTSSDFWRRASRARITKGDVLLNGTGIGTIGRANYMFDGQPAVADNHVTIIRTRDETVPAEVLALFLNTRGGRFQTERWLTGSSGQIELYPEDLRRFAIPVLPDRMNDELVTMVRNSYEALVVARAAQRLAVAALEAVIDAKME